MFHRDPTGAGTPDPGAAVPRSRRSFLRRSAVAGVAGSAVIAAVGGRAHGAPRQRPRDLSAGWEARNFRSIQKHENDHAQFLAAVLTANAPPKPQFVNLQQPNLRAFERVSLAFE